MIATLSGTVANIDLSSLVLDVNGVGYELFCPISEITGLKLGETKNYFIYEHIREDTHDLYGFTDKANKGMFEQLLSVNGVGPKVALAIVSGVENLSDVIRSGNIAALQTVSGVGKRVAERIIVDLSNKLGSNVDILSSKSNTSLYEALTQLGYSTVQSHEVIAKMPSELNSDEDRIKWALRELGK